MTLRRTNHNYENSSLLIIRYSPISGSTYKEKACTRSTCDGGIFTFEKTSSHFLRTARQENLQLSSNTPGITLVDLSLNKKKVTGCLCVHMSVYSEESC